MSSACRVPAEQNKDDTRSVELVNEEAQSKPSQTGV
jgi:hypothetical protein